MATKTAATKAAEAEEAAKEKQAAIEAELAKQKEDEENEKKRIAAEAEAKQKKEMEEQQALEAERIKAAQNGSEFIPKESERHLYHVRLEKKQFKQTTGEKISKAYNQCFKVKEFHAFNKIDDKGMSNAERLGFRAYDVDVTGVKNKLYDIEVLWNPEEYNK